MQLPLLPLLPLLLSTLASPQKETMEAVALVTKCRVRTLSGALTFRSITAIGRRADIVRLI